MLPIDLGLENLLEGEDEADAEAERLLEEREAARKARDFATADAKLGSLVKGSFKGRGVKAEFSLTSSSAVRSSIRRKPPQATASPITPERPATR